VYTKQSSLLGAVFLAIKGGIVIGEMFYLTSIKHLSTVGASEWLDALGLLLILLSILFLIALYKPVKVKTSQLFLSKCKF